MRRPLARIPTMDIDRRGGSPEIGVVMTNPAARSHIYSAPCDFRFSTSQSPFESMFMTLRQIRSLRQASSSSPC